MTFVAMVGDRNVAYESHRAIEATVALLAKDVDMRWVGTDDPNFRRTVESADAVWALPGTPYANDAATYAAIRMLERPGSRSSVRVAGSNTPWWNTPGTWPDGGAPATPKTPASRASSYPITPSSSPPSSSHKWAALHGEGVHPLIRALIEAGS
jgi:hypothetical protein